MTYILTATDIKTNEPVYLSHNEEGLKQDRFGPVSIAQHFDTKSEALEYAAAFHKHNMLKRLNIKDLHVETKP